MLFLLDLVTGGVKTLLYLLLIATAIPIITGGVVIGWDTPLTQVPGMVAGWYLQLVINAVMQRLGLGVTL